ncbi:MAG: hypothetical protein J0L76_17415 [Rhodobacterales bacterium]|nr:hypothetical protein [Rhodobacterales bacterium]
MKFSVLTFLALIPTSALAGYECTATQQCGGGTCEPYAGGPFLIEEAGDVWRVSTDGQAWEGYQTTTVEAGGEVSIVLPPQNGMSGLVSIFPSGEFLFTAHAYGQGAVAITGSGNCMAEGG